MLPACSVVAFPCAKHLLYLIQLFTFENFYMEFLIENLNKLKLFHFLEKKTKTTFILDGFKWFWKLYNLSYSDSSFIYEDQKS